MLRPGKLAVRRVNFLVLPRIFPVRAVVRHSISERTGISPENPIPIRDIAGTHAQFPHVLFHHARCFRHPHPPLFDFRVRRFIPCTVLANPGCRFPKDSVVEAPNEGIKDAKNSSGWR